jgi:hypothetical protein
MIRLQSWRSRWWSPLYTSIFTAFMWLAKVDAGLDFKVIEYSEEDEWARFARKNQILKFTTKTGPPHIDFYSLHVTSLAWCRTHFRGYWTLWRRWSSQNCQNKSGGQDAQDPPPLHPPDITWWLMLQRLLLVFLSLRNQLGMIPECCQTVWNNMCKFTSYPPQRLIFTGFPWLARTPAAFFLRALELSEHNVKAIFARKNRVHEIC